MLNLQSDYNLKLQAQIEYIRPQIDDLYSSIVADDVECSVMVLRHIISQLTSLGDEIDFYRYVTYKQQQNEANKPTGE